ncbi:MAG: relaxase/mobilization nuclease domain-containing protein [Desulfovibrio sp.]
MLMKVFAHGIGRGGKAIDYVTDPKRPGREKSPPVVLRGDAELVRRVIDSTERKWKYTSGVLSWAPEDKVTPEEEEEIINSFESVAFAGLKPDQISSLWVRHSHSGHHELHFIIPRTELYQGKAFNPCPPGWDKQYNVWRDYWNIKKEWARPDDPARKRAVAKPMALKFAGKVDRVKAVESITRSLTDAISVGMVKSREDIVSTLKNAGFGVLRAGKNYITIETPDKTRIRLKGGIYGSAWRFDRAASRAAGQQDERDGAGNRLRVQELSEKVEEVRRARAGYHKKRYPQRISARDAVAFGLNGQGKKDLSYPARSVSRFNDAALHHNNMGTEMVGRVPNGRTFSDGKEGFGTERREKAIGTARNRHNQLQGRHVHHTTTRSASQDRMDQRETPSNKSGEVTNDRARNTHEASGGTHRTRTDNKAQRVRQTDSARGTGAERLPRITERVRECFTQAIEVMRGLAMKMQRGRGQGR